MKLTIGLIAVALTVAIIWYAPKYLTYADEPAKSDVIVLFIGLDFNARKKEAVKLMEEGYARHLLIPAHGTMITSPTDTHYQPDKQKKQKKPDKPEKPKYFEDTHIEMLEAKKAIDKAGFKSAIFVSSPFHMRRIKVMATSLFDNDHLNMKFVPTRFDKKENGFWLLSTSTIENVTREYLKIVWFLTYRMFS
jgi:hypothetical protein